MTAIAQRSIKDKKAKIFLVDDHPLMRQGLTQLIDQEADFKVCGESENAHKALESIASLKPDLAIIDVSLNSTNGIDLMKSIKVRYPHLPVLILSMHDESLYAERSLRAGAKGYIMKREATENVLKAIRKLLAGGIYISENMGTKMLQRIVDSKSGKAVSPIERLSDREMEVFQLIGQAKGTRQIAKMLHLSIKTIESHRAHIKEKLELNNAAELVQHAVRWVQMENEG